MAIIRVGNVVADKSVFGKLPTRATKVSSWDSASSPITYAETYRVIEELGLIGQRLFDAAHGFRFILLVYETAAQKSDIMDFLTGATPCLG